MCSAGSQRLSQLAPARSHLQISGLPFTLGAQERMLRAGLHTTSVRNGSPVCRVPLHSRAATPHHGVGSGSSIRLLERLLQGSNYESCMAVCATHRQVSSAKCFQLFHSASRGAASPVSVVLVLHVENKFGLGEISVEFASCCWFTKCSSGQMGQWLQNTVNRYCRQQK